MRNKLSRDELEKLKELTETTKMTWGEKGRMFDPPLDGEAARSQYRRYIGRKNGPYTHKKMFTGDTIVEKEEKENSMRIVYASECLMSKEDIIKKFEIDLNIWEIEKYRVRTSQGYRKDKSVKWVVEDGKTVSGIVNDSGNMLVVQLYHIELLLKRKKEIASAKEVIEQMVEDAKNFSPVYEKIEYPKHKDGVLFEIAIYDLHFGRLTWNEESGEDYDISIATKLVKSALLKLLSRADGRKIDRILFPLGNDFFNVDSKLNTTTNGTPQQEDTRWQKTFKRGRELCVWMIDTCSLIAPVDVLIIPGNHDQQRSFYLGDSLECWYRNNPNVNIDNKAMMMKYYHFGNNLIGFTHGYETSLAKLPLIMANDQPDLWGKTSYREWHTGDKHHKKDLSPLTDEGSGMTVRVIRSLVPYDAWTFNKGYRSLRASEAFVWHPEDGLSEIHTAIPDKEN